MTRVADREMPRPQWTKTPEEFGPSAMNSKTRAKCWVTWAKRGPRASVFGRSESCQYDTVCVGESNACT